MLLAAYNYYRDTQVTKFGQPGDSTPYYWYGPDALGYYFHVFWNMTYPAGSESWDCGRGTPGGGRYWAGFSSTAGINTCQDGNTSLGGGGGPTAVILELWSQFRGMNGVNPSAPPTQQDANAWTQGQIDGGHWPDVVKPALDAVIRPVVASADLQAVGIRGNPPIDQPPEVRIIAIDAGHAPVDYPAHQDPQYCWGTTGPTIGQREDALVSAITQQVAADFQARGHTVILTRPPNTTNPNGCTYATYTRQDGSTYIAESQASLQSRVDASISGSSPANIFVSIHHNAMAGNTPNPYGGDPYDPTANGTEAWYEGRSGYGDPTFSLALAQRVVDQQSRLGLYNRGPKINGIDGSPFFILGYMPNQTPLGRAIDEVAFLTNTTGTCPDESRLTNQPCDPTLRVRAANAIENAIRLAWP